MERLVFFGDDQEEDHCMLEPTAEVTEILKIVQVPRLAVYLHKRIFDIRDKKQFIVM